MYTEDPRYDEEIFVETISFSDMNNKSFDLYCYPEHPCDIIYEKYCGYLLLDEEFRKIIVSELKKYNPTVYRVSTAAFAIFYAENNPPSLSVNYKSKNYTLSKRKVTINNID